MQASVVTEKVTKSIVDIQLTEDYESFMEEEVEESPTEKENEVENDKLQEFTMDKLEKASDDSFLPGKSFIHFDILKLCVLVLTVKIWGDGNLTGFAFLFILKFVLCFCRHQFALTVISYHYDGSESIFGFDMLCLTFNVCRA